jgi:hypothetical protein
VLSPTGTEPYLDVEPVTAQPTPSAPAGTITVTAYDPAGAVAAQLRAIDLAPGRSGRVDVVLPIAEAARIELTRDGGLPSVASRSATAPTAALTTLKGGGRIGAKGTLRLAWAMADADGDALRADVAYSADDGRTWTPLGTVDDASELRVPAAWLTRSARGRLRVVVSDGLWQATATTGRLRVAGVPPRVTLRSAATTRVARNAAVRLSAFADDQTGQPVTGARLRWLEGTKRLGQGETITLRYAKRGTHTISLVATDRTGLATTRTLRVIVR